jgi:hypothetical protein
VVGPDTVPPVGVPVPVAVVIDVVDADVLEPPSLPVVPSPPESSPQPNPKNDAAKMTRHMRRV